MYKTNNTQEMSRWRVSIWIELIFVQTTKVLRDQFALHKKFDRFENFFAKTQFTRRPDRQCLELADVSCRGHRNLRLQKLRRWRQKCQEWTLNRPSSRNKASVVCAPWSKLFQRQLVTISKVWNRKTYCNLRSYFFFQIIRNNWDDNLLRFQRVIELLSNLLDGLFFE